MLLKQQHASSSGCLHFFKQCGIKTQFKKVRSLVFYILQCKCKSVSHTKYVANYFFNLSSLDFSK